MSNIRAITGSTKIMNRPTHGGSKKQGIASSTNLNTTSHVAFRNRNVVCPCNRHHVFCMNQLGGVGAGGIPGRSYMFASTADGINKNKILCGINHKNIKHPSQFELIYIQDTPEKINNPVIVDFFQDNNIVYLKVLQKLDKYISSNSNFDSITRCYYIGNTKGTDINCYSKLYGYIYVLKIKDENINKIYTISFVIEEYIYNNPYPYGMIIRFINRPSFFTNTYYTPLSDDYPKLKVTEIFKSTYRVNV